MTLAVPTGQVLWICTHKLILHNANHHPLRSWFDHTCSLLNWTFMQGSQEISCSIFKSIKMCCKYEFQQMLLLKLSILRFSPILRRNGTHLKQKENIWNCSLEQILNALNMQKNSWNIINLNQILIIASLQLLEPTPKRKLATRIIVLPLWYSSKIQDYNDSWSTLEIHTCWTPLHHQLHRNVLDVFFLSVFQDLVILVKRSAMGQVPSQGRDKWEVVSLCPLSHNTVPCSMDSHLCCTFFRNIQLQDDSSILVVLILYN